jgi:hypothetical protein
MKDHISSTRRAFFGKAGAAVAVPLTLAAGSVGAGDLRGNDLEARVIALEDRAVIRALHEAFVVRVNSGDEHALHTLSASPQPSGPARAVTRLLHDHASGHTDSIVVASDGHRATASFSCIARIATPVTADGTLADMMRLQGSDFVQREERGVLECHFTKVHGDWKMERVAYRPV